MSIKILIVGPAASGKTTLAKKLAEKGFKVAKLHTTRPKRDESDDEYIFTDRKPNELHPVKCEFNGWWYYLVPVQLDADVFILGPKMAQQMKDFGKWNAYLTIFLDVPESIRYERLMKRDMPGDLAIARIGRDRADFAHFTDYDIRIHENHAEQPIVIASVVHFLNESPC
jgi:guanylate kinase